MRNELEKLMQTVAAGAAATASHTGIAEFDPRVLAAMREVLRHEFVPESSLSLAYVDVPLPIGHGQTISQPYIVALMTHLLALKPGDHTLEVGGGSGYQAAIMGQLANEVHTVEIVPALARACRERLARLGVHNVFVHEGDGTLGLPPKAPFDAILVAAAAREVPPALIEQLKPGGRMVIPVGEVDTVQSLQLLQKDLHGNYIEHNLLPVRFVPLIGS